MGRPLLAAGRTAEVPYRMKIIDRNVRTVEELCYSLEQCAAFVDESVCDPLLPDWLEEQCGLSALAKQLRPLLKERGAEQEFVLRILAFTAYQTPEKIQQIRREMERGRGLAPFKRRLKEAKAAAEAGQRGQALEMLDELEEELPALERFLRAQILELRGRLAAGSFLYEQAAACYERAWKLSGRKETCLQYLAAVRFSKDPAAYEAFLRENPALQETARSLEKKIADADRAAASGTAGRRLGRLQRSLESGKNRAFDAAAEQQLWEMQDDFRAGHAPSL